MPHETAVGPKPGAFDPFAESDRQDAEIARQATSHEEPGLLSLTLPSGPVLLMDVAAMAVLAFLALRAIQRKVGVGVRHPPPESVLVAFAGPLRWMFDAWGRSGCREYWYWKLWYLPAAILAEAVQIELREAAASDRINLWLGLAFVPVIVMAIANATLTMRRLRDAGYRPSRWGWLYFLPFATWVLCAFPTKKPNVAISQDAASASTAPQDVVPDPFAVAGRELQSGKLDPGAWARALLHGDGDEHRAKAHYVRLRVEQLSASKATPAPAE